MQLPAPQDFSRVTVFELPADYAGQRIDNFLITLFKGVPRSRVYRIIRKGEVRVNRKRVQPSYKLQAQDLLRLPPIRVSDVVENGSVAVGAGLRALLSAAVLYEDASLLVINKPSGLAVHGGSGLKLGLIEALRAMRVNETLELVHRLDRETSGCLLVAKKRSALRDLHAQMRAGSIAKSYLALASGDWPRHLDEVRAPLLKNHLNSGERVVIVTAEGKASHTRFKVLQRYGCATLLEAMPVTGRTHQIRVHARFAGCPLVDDDKYGDDVPLPALKGLESRRLFLHASKLGFVLPSTGQRMDVEAPLPKALQRVLERLERKR
jgi:23S rRNA pseudouridine955/2504/2580 synthase